MYRGGTEADFYCEEQDEDCRAEYKDRVTVYLVISLCIFLVVILLCAISCIKRRKAELALKAKKAPLAAYPNKKDFERLDKEQGDNKGGGAGGKKNPLADVLEMAKRMKAA